MRTGWLTVGLLGGAAIVSLATFVLVLTDGPRPKTARGGEAVLVARQHQPAKAKRPESTAIETGGGQRRPDPKAGPTTIAKRVASGGDSKENLSDGELMEKVLGELAQALDEAVAKGDFKTVLALAERLRGLNYGMLANGRSARSAGLVKGKLLEALLKEGSAAGVAVALDLLNDPEPVIAEAAEDLLFKSLNDLSLGDYRRAEIVTAAAEELTETLSLNRLFNEFIKMRHSVGVDALKTIAKNGTENAKRIISERVIGGFTGDATMKSADQLDDWLKEFPDKAQDARFYGPIIIPGSVK